MASWQLVCKVVPTFANHEVHGLDLGGHVISVTPRSQPLDTRICGGVCGATSWREA